MGVIVSQRTVDTGDYRLAADIFTPAYAARPIVLCCLPGGGMSRRYWDLPVPDDESYSFALWMVHRGITVIAIDHIGTGESPLPDGRAPLLGEAIAANDTAFRLLCKEISETGIGGGPIPNPLRVGVGHSMGALLTIRQQAVHQTHDGLALDGFSMAGLPAVLAPEILDTIGDEPPSDELLAELTLHMFGSPYPMIGMVDDHTQEPADPVRQALTQAGTRLLGAGGLLSLLPGNVADDAARVRVPVLLLNGVHDRLIGENSVDPAQFGASARFDAHLLPDAGHNHNVAPSRELFWAKVLHWAGELRRCRA
jgi:alpha-beta hydrolase superfamily lysophospholipase